MKYLLICLLIVFSGHSQRVLKVIDGDTFYINNKVVRIKSIDSPERTQQYGKQSKYRLKKLLQGKRVQLTQVSLDKYGRTLAVVFLGKLDVAEYMIKNGFSHHYIYYSSNRNYARLERIAQSKRLGLWQYDNVISPYKFRKTT